jgi:hypothetical protein
MHELDAALADAGPDAAVDAWHTVDASVSVPDASCPAESCNGHDDDCDGFVDEGLASVGPTVATSSVPGFSFVTLIGAAAGFGLIGTNGATLVTNGAPYWTPVGLDGAPSAAPVHIGMIDQAQSVSALAIGDDIIALTTRIPPLSAPPGTRLPGVAFWFAASSPGASTSASLLTEISSSRSVDVVDFTGGAATTYALDFNGSASELRRHRLALSGSTISVTGSADVLGPSNAFDAVTAGGHEVGASAAVPGVVIFQSARGDAAPAASTIGPIAGLPSDGTFVAVAVPDSGLELSTANRLGIVVARSSGNGISFVTMSSFEASGVTAPLTLPGARGGGPVAVVSAPGAGETRFLVAALEDTLRVWEVSGSPTAARSLIVEGDWSTQRLGLSLATSQGTVRLAETDDAGNVVTRSIGCH